MQQAFLGEDNNVNDRISFVGAYFKMWRNTFNYKGVASRKEYFYPLIVQAVVSVIALDLTIACIILGYDGQLPGVCANLLGLYLIISILPWISLTIRRLRDTGKSGKWMMLLLVVGVGLVILIFLCSAAGVFMPELNEGPIVYGPPEGIGDY